MQPYFFPYLGYFQLIKSVDKFVLLDDVQYIDSGWVNRNQLYSNGQKFYFTVPINSLDRKRLINDVRINNLEYIRFVTKFKKTLFSSYRRAPNFAGVFSEIDALLSKKVDRIFDLAEGSILQTCKFLKIGTPILRSSDLNIQTKYGPQDNIIQIVKLLGGTHYLNMIGGAHLYNTEYFDKEGIVLEFFDPQIPIYNRGDKEFVAGLSCIDFMMWANDEINLQY
jgi:hypothetical protein